MIPFLNDRKLKRPLQQNEIAELRKFWLAGIKSGPGRFADMDAIKAEARKRFFRHVSE